MVLDNASTTPDFVSDSSPTSDNDPYSSSNDGQTANTDPAATTMLDISKFPGPIPLFGPLCGYTTTYRIAFIQRRMVDSTQILQRSLSVDEATALALHTSKGMSIASWGPPIGLIWGSYRAYSTAANYKFPFLTPNPEKFESFVFAGMVRGRQAQLCWHGCRWLAYSAFGTCVSNAIFNTYGAVTAAVGEQRDPRLQDLVKAIKVKMNQELGEAKTRLGEAKRGSGRQPVGHTGDPTGQGQTTMPELSKNHRQAIGDDASPTGGYNDTEDGASLAQSGDGILSDQQMRTQEQRQQATPGKSPTENRASTSTSFDDFDDASPTAGQGPVDATSGGGSRWERIRSQSSAQGEGGARAVKRGSSTQQERMEGSTTGDSFTFSETESDRPSTRSEAQREFDERVERERRGGDFNAGRGGR
ncbi:MAG: hypothetical protein M1812_005201 [Candelaria pacifica]|nr:MAG: hypothetical protein M1812_005201 [Candelaria pacifica]